MDNGPILDELRHLESEVVAGEGRLAELEASVAKMRREKLDTGERCRVERTAREPAISPTGSAAHPVAVAAIGYPRKWMVFMMFNSTRRTDDALAL